MDAFALSAHGVVFLRMGGRPLEVVTLIIMLLVILVAARLAGEASERFGQPAIIGELLAGIILGPTLLGFLDPLSLPPEDLMKVVLDVVSTLAIFFVVFYAGLEMSVKDLTSAVCGKGLYFAVGSFVVTFLAGYATGFYFMQDHVGASFLGLCVAITALPVSIKLLADLGRLHTRTGNAIIGTAMVQDIIAITVLSILIGLNVKIGHATPFTILMMVMKITIFLLLIFALERSFHIKDGWLAGKLTATMSKVKSKEGQFSIAVIVAMYFAVIAEFLGLSYIIGAFYGGLIFSKFAVGEMNFAAIKRGTSGIAMGFFAPIFICYIGLMFNLRELLPILGMFLVVLIVAVVSMFGSGYLGARMAGYNEKEARIIGVGINTRGMMEMVVALVGYNYGFIDKNFFSILVGMALVTTMVTPSLLKYLYARLPEEKAASAEEREEQILKEMREWLKG
ncbi:MAG: cation:proton antiporter [Methanobacteriota archaeon]